MATNKQQRAARAAQSEAVTVKALVPVDYDINRNEVGATFEVRAEDVDQLLEVKAVELVDPADAEATAA